MKGERKGGEEVWGWQRKRGGAETLEERVRKRGWGKYSGGRAEFHKQGGFEEEKEVTASNGEGGREKEPPPLPLPQLQCRQGRAETQRGRVRKWKKKTFRGGAKCG